jgi:hypothetical protein
MKTPSGLKVKLAIVASPDNQEISFVEQRNFAKEVQIESGNNKIDWEHYDSVLAKINSQRNKKQ